MLIFILTFWLGVLAPPPEPIEMAPCVQFKGYTWLANGAIGLTFYNFCGTSMKINVCVTDFYGKKRLFQSDLVKNRGWYRVYMEDRMQPRDFHFTYGLRAVPIPEGCTI